MERRDFIKAGTLAAAGMSITDFSLFGKDIKTDVPFSKQDASWTLNDDGSFSYKSGEFILKDCYPSFNGQPIFVKSVEVARNTGGGEMIYNLKDGRIKLLFSSDTDSLVLKSILDIPIAPHYFYPMGFAVVSGANKYMKQGLGFAGPSGIFEFPQAPVKRESHQHDEAWSFDSYLVSGFFSKSDNALAIGAYEHDNYLQRSTYYNRTYRFGLIDRHLNEDNYMIEVGFGTEEIKLSGPCEMPALHFISGTEPFATFRHFAENTAKANNVKINNKPRYQWCSWYEYESKYTQANLDDLISGLKTIKPALPIDTLQIDDGFAERGDWLIPVKERYPNGIEYMVQSIFKAGYKAGIWVGPFMVSENSKVYKEHPDWLIRDMDNKPFMESIFPEGKHYVLDTTHPEAFENLRNIFRSFKKMGVTYYKTDFMDWGLRDRTKFRRYDNSKTGVQNFMTVVKMIRQEIGPESFWLGCIAPFPPMIGYADAVRFSNDIPPKWNNGSQGNLIQEGEARHFMQHVLWQNDPDTVFLRDLNSNLNSQLTGDEALTIALFDAMIGGFVMSSDRFHKITPEYLKLWRFLQPGSQQMSCRFPYWSGNKKLKVAVRDYADGSSAILIVNPSADTIKEEYPVKELVGKDSAWFFGWKPGENSPEGQKSAISVELKSHQSVLYYVNKINKAPDKELNLFGIKVKGI